MRGGYLVRTGPFDARRRRLGPADRGDRNADPRPSRRAHGSRVRAVAHVEQFDQPLGADNGLRWKHDACRRRGGSRGHEHCDPNPGPAGCFYCAGWGTIACLEYFHEPMGAANDWGFWLVDSGGRRRRAVEFKYCYAIAGRQVLSTAPTAGQALVWNGSTSRWEPQTITGSGGPAPMASQMGDLIVTQTSGTVLTIGPNCSFVAPCNVRFGALTYALNNPVTVTLSSGTGAAFVYLASTGILTVGHSLVLSCSGTCAAPPGIIAFPTDSVPLFQWHATNGAWDSSGTDQRAFLSSKDVIPGAGMLSTEALGHTTIGADPSVISLRTTVPGTSGATCSAGAWATDSTFYYLCVSQNSWRRASLSTKARRLNSTGSRI